ncbi:MAG: HAD family hydrolase [Actinomycetota bacterium]|nr:HAD family hydrolase [Actinomycetota bacterium]
MVDVLALPDGRDHRLDRAYAALDAGQVSVLSFDLFDTVLWRQVPRPSDAFLLLGERLATTEALVDWLDPWAFRRLRIGAEDRARADSDAAGDTTEVTIHRIWAELAPAVLVTPDPAAGVAAEVALERQITVADLDIVELIDAADAHGCPIAVVSNTYLTETQLIGLVDRPELAPLRNARIFSSCAYGVHKTNGLWKVVIKELGVPAERILHIGDDRDADVSAPGDLGVRAVHFRHVDSLLRPILDREFAMPLRRQAPSAAVVSVKYGDFGITGLRAKVIARPHLERFAPDVAIGWTYGAGVLGPVLAGFADWVHGRVVDADLPTAWCMMREGELLADLVGRVAEVRRSGLDARPLWLSRHVTARAALARADDEELRSLLVRRLSPTVGRYLTNLGLSLAEVPDLRGRADRRMDDPGLVDEVIGRLVGCDQVRLRILTESAAARARLLRYLRSTIGEPEAVALVDLGWGATIQRNLARVFQVAGVATRTIGLYLATNDSSVSRSLDGLHIEGYLIQNGQPEWAIDEIGRSPEVIEQACLATTGSVIDFDEKGAAVLDNSVPPPTQVISKVAVQQGVRALQTEWLRYERLSSTWTRPADRRERPQLIEILRMSITKPTASEARAFGSWGHEDNFGADDRERIVPDRLGPAVPYLAPQDLAEMTMNDAFWPAGLAAEYDPVLAAASASIAEGRVPCEVFDCSWSPTDMEASHTGGGLRGWAGRQTRPLRVNRNGLSYARFDLRRPHIEAVRFDPTDQAAVIRLDWVELTLTVEGRPGPQRMRYDTEADLAALRYIGCRWLGDGLVVSTGSDPQVHFLIGPAVEGNVSQAILEVGFAVLVLPGRTPAPGLTSTPYRAVAAHTAARFRAEAQDGWPALRHDALGAARRLARRMMP